MAEQTAAEVLAQRLSQWLRHPDGSPDHCAQALLTDLDEAGWRVVNDPLTRCVRCGQEQTQLTCGNNCLQATG